MSTKPNAAEQEQDAAVSQPASYDDATIKAREHTASIPAHSKSQYRRLTAQGADALLPASQSDTPIIDQLTQLIGQYGVQCSETEELAPTTEFSNALLSALQLERALNAERQKHDATELRLEQTVANLVHEREALITADKVTTEFQDRFMDELKRANAAEDELATLKATHERLRQLAKTVDLRREEQIHASRDNYFASTENFINALDALRTALEKP